MIQDTTWEKVKEYEKMFGEKSFPVIPFFRLYEEDRIQEMIDTCIKNKKSLEELNIYNPDDDNY